MHAQIRHDHHFRLEKGRLGDDENEICERMTLRTRIGETRKEKLIVKE